jgi:hypothetical protein
MGCGASAPAHVIGTEEAKKQQESKSIAANGMCNWRKAIVQ